MTEPVQEGQPEIPDDENLIAGDAEERLDQDPDQVPNAPNRDPSDAPDPDEA
jgi:hypothetical protein